MPAGVDSLDCERATLSVRILVVVGTAAVLAVGIGRIIASIRRQMAERNEVEEFANTFARYVTSDSSDLQAYGWLIERSYVIQGLLGPIGIMATFIAPYRTHVVHNYDIVLNGLPAMRRDFERGISRSDYQPLIGEALVRYLGFSADMIHKRQRELKSPLAWLREGVGALLLVPVWLLHSLGVVSITSTRSIAGSALFRVISGIVALVGLAGSLITILLGWDQTIAFVRHLVHK